MAFVKLDEDALRVVCSGLHPGNVIGIRLRTLLAVFPNMDEDAVIDVFGNGLPDSPTVIGVPIGVAEEFSGDVDRNTAGTPSEPESETPRDPWPEGKRPFATPPFGWQRRGVKIIGCKPEQDVIKYVLKGQKKGWSNAQIAEDLNGRSLTTRRGSKWNSSGVGRLIKRSIPHEQNKALVKRWS